MRTWLLNVITSWQPDFVGIEDIQLQKFYNPKTGQMDAAVTTYKGSCTITRRVASYNR